MPSDGHDALIVVSPETRLHEDDVAADARLIRRARRRLVAWSGGVTLVVLLVLGSVLYVAVARSFEASSLARLQARAETLALSHGDGDFDDSPPLELVMGGTSSGTFAFLVSDDGDVFGPGFDVPAELPDADSVAAALERGEDVRTIVLDDVPFRVRSTRVSEALVSPTMGRVPISVVQVVEDRSAEAAALSLLTEILVVGGLAALVAALLLGAVYANRALVPIRQSLAAQHLALRRQREFAADASHELRTPLAIIRASVDDLREHPDQPVGEVGTALGDIDAEVEHVTELVDELLLLARSDSGALDLALEPVELGDVATVAAAGMAAPAARRGISINVDPEPVMVSADQKRVRQLVTILVDNAVRHSPTGKRVDVSVRSDGRSAVLLVEDEGPGIDPADLPHVFDRFWRGRDARREGTGLGLAIAAAIVARHGGSIEATNRPQRGASFRVLLPLLEAPAGQSSSQEAPVAPGPETPTGR